MWFEARKEPWKAKAKTKKKMEEKKTSRTNSDGDDDDKEKKNETRKMSCKRNDYIGKTMCTNE